MKIKFLILIGIILIAQDMKGQAKVVSDPQAPSTEGLTYAAPSEVGLDSAYIHHRVDSIMTNAIKQQAFPGAQVLVAKNGKIIFHKAYGHHTYDSYTTFGLGRSL